MRIGMLTDNYKTHVSGVTNYISQIKRCLENAGQEVYVFTFGKNSEGDNENNIIYTPGIPIADFYLNIQYSQLAIELLSSMDIVHVHHPFSSGILARRYCKPRNIPIVFTNHTRYDLYTQAYLPIFPKTMSEAGLKAYLSQFYRACNLVIIPSDSMYQVLVEHFGLDAPVVIVPNGVDLEPFCGGNQPVDRHIFGFSKDDVISIYIGRLGPEKNLSFLLNAINKVTLSNSHLRLLIVGNGPERINLEIQVKNMGIESKVFFTGMIPYSDVPHYLAASDLFITSSITEVFPLSVIEAIGAGLPVLGINAPGIRDIIEDGKTGLISPNDLESFTAKLVLLSNDHELRQAMGKQAIQSSKKYDIRTITRILIQHYQRLVDTAKQSNQEITSKPTRFLDKFQ
jgi:glycosyltransferase involved in cell wall biosynthesis